MESEIEKNRIENSEQYRNQLEDDEILRNLELDAAIVKINELNPDFNSLESDLDGSFNNEQLQKNLLNNHKDIINSQEYLDGNHDGDLLSDMKLLEEIENGLKAEIELFEDYEEEANEELANRLKNLNFVFPQNTDGEIDKIIARVAHGEIFNYNLLRVLNYNIVYVT
jgi:hypothetical protein